MKSSVKISIHTSLVALMSALPISAAAGEFHLSLADPSEFNIEGPHRFMEVAGYTGFQPTHLKTRAWIETDLHTRDRGSLSVWITALETLDFYSAVSTVEDRNIFWYPIVTDRFPARDVTRANFALYYSNLYPPLRARLTNRGEMWGILDYDLAPFVYAERLILRKGHWYMITFNWDKVGGLMELYINGIIVARVPGSRNYTDAIEKLYLGNPAMLVRDLNITPEPVAAPDIRDHYEAFKPGNNGDIDRELRSHHVPGFHGIFNEKPEGDWKLAYSTSFNSEEEFRDWFQQTGDPYRDQFTVKITEEGLLFKNPERIEKETRMINWCPAVFEGDIWIEYEFRLESDEGLALCIMNASGMQREDIMKDRALKNTGSMAPMLHDFRNYHWEYMRRVCLNRTDVETQFVQKNPWDKKLYAGCIPSIEKHKWNRLQFIKDGRRLTGVLNGQIVFDVQDDPFDNNGPLLSNGRVGLRQMFKAQMTYRNFKVYTKPAQE